MNVIFGTWNPGPARNPGAQWFEMSGIGAEFAVPST